MIRREFDPAPVNALLNHPAIRPTIGGDGGLDAADLIADRRNVCLMGDGGGMLFAWHGPGVFDAHVFMLARGRRAIALAVAMLGKMAAEHGALHIWALIPAVSRNVHWFARQCGMTSLGPITAPAGEQELFEMRF